MDGAKDFRKPEKSGPRLARESRWLRSVDKRDFCEPLYDLGRLGEEVIVESSSPPEAAWVGESGGEPGIVPSTAFACSEDLGTVALRTGRAGRRDGGICESAEGKSGSSFSSFWSISGDGTVK